MGKRRIRYKHSGSAALLETRKKLKKILISLPGMVEHVAGHVEGSGVAVVQADPVKKPNVKRVQYRRI